MAVPVSAAWVDADFGAQAGDRDRFGPATVSDLGALLWFDLTSLACSTIWPGSRASARAQGFGEAVGGAVK